MIRMERNNKKGRQPLPADCGGGHHCREAVSYISQLRPCVFPMSATAYGKFNLLASGFSAIA